MPLSSTTGTAQMLPSSTGQSTYQPLALGSSESMWQRITAFRPT